MKKVLLIGLILAFCVLAFPLGVSAAPTPVSIPINANYAATTTFAANEVTPSGGWSWVLTVGPNDKSPALHFSVTSLADWTVTATDASGAGHTAGFMQGSLHHLNAPLQMQKKDTSYGTLLTPLIVGTGTPSTSPQPWEAALRQPVDATDYASSSGYAMTVQFDCSVPF